jgi:hypothetical protein
LNNFSKSFGLEHMVPKWRLQDSLADSHYHTNRSQEEAGRPTPCRWDELWVIYNRRPDCSVMMGFCEQFGWELELW